MYEEFFENGCTGRKHPGIDFGVFCAKKIHCFLQRSIMCSCRAAADSDPYFQFLVIKPDFMKIIFFFGVVFDVNLAKSTKLLPFHENMIWIMKIIYCSGR